MKTFSKVRRVDELGRIIIHKELRRQLYETIYEITSSYEKEFVNFLSKC